MVLRRDLFSCDRLTFPCLPHRRNFLKLGAAFATGVIGLDALPGKCGVSDTWLIGPIPGFTSERGTLVSMPAFTRMQVLHNVKGISTADLDFLLDGKANTIGALLNHLAATEPYHQASTFEGFAWDKFFDAPKQ